MIRATELAGRAVIDIDAAERLGTIDKLILDPDGRRVAGFVVVRGSGFPGNREHMTVPASAIRAIGPDAVTVHQQTAVAGSDIGRLETLPRGSDLIGRKVVSEEGRFLGKVNDVLIDRDSGRIIGYLLAEHKPGKKMDEMLGTSKKRRDFPYLPADAKLRAGHDLIVTSEDALVYDWSDEEVTKREPGAPIGQWTDPLPASDIPSSWTRNAGSTVDDEMPATGRPGEDVDGREVNPHVR
jgi:sporulation protein YlmC with PRC-barrel domain